MKKTLFAIILFALAAASATAQTFNPRVEVENTYEGKIVEAGKQALPMSVPDSLYQFQYKLDYTVFDNPYQGSYKFQPYSIEMKPEAAPSAARRLYASLGAGWSLHPELDLVWSPEFKNRPLKLSVYDNFRGFWGNYGLMQYEYAEGRALPFRIPRKPVNASQGYVFDNKVGADLRYEFGNVALEFDGGYRLFTTQDTLSNHFLQLGEAEIRLLPLDPNKADYFYGGRFYVNAGQDKMDALTFGRHKLGVNDMGADLRFGAPFGSRARILLDLGMEASIYSGLLDAAATCAWATPRFTYRWGSGYAELGVRLSYLKGSDNSGKTPEFSVKEGGVYAHKSNYIYPAVKVKQYIVPEHLAIYAKAVGGDRIHKYSDLLRENPFADPEVVVFNMDASSERVNAALGFEGDIAGRFQFDLHGGYSVMLNGRCDAVESLNQWRKAPEGGWKGNYLSGYYNYCDYNRVYADFSFLWKSPRLDLDGHFLYQDTDLMKNNWLAIAPARFSGEMRAVYNWNRQAFAGLCVEAASRREGSAAIFFTPSTVAADIQVAGWVDLGLYGRYVINPHIAVWAKAGNLLGQSVQRYFLHPEKGPYGTLGISFNL